MCIAYALLVASVAGALVCVTPGVAAPDHGGSNDAVGQGGQGEAAIQPPGDGSPDGPEHDGDRDVGAHWKVGIQRTASLHSTPGRGATGRTW